MWGQRQSQCRTLGRHWQNSNNIKKNKEDPEEGVLKEIWLTTSNIYSNLTYWNESFYAPGEYNDANPCPSWLSVTKYLTHVWDNSHDGTYDMSRPLTVVESAKDLARDLGCEYVRFHYPVDNWCRFWHYIADIPQGTAWDTSRIDNTGAVLSAKASQEYCEISGAAVRQNIQVMEKVDGGYVNRTLISNEYTNSINAFSFWKDMVSRGVTEYSFVPVAISGGRTRIFSVVAFEKNGDFYFKTRPNVYDENGDPVEDEEWYWYIFEPIQTTMYANHAFVDYRMDCRYYRPGEWTIEGFVPGYDQYAKLRVYKLTKTAFENARRSIA